MSSESNETKNFISQLEITSKTHQETFDKEKNHSQTHSSMKYRPDIDGLRAVAISSAVIFHFWPDFLTGGFIGVDVFFVISGFLITSILLKEIKKNTFSYKNFYSRRIKRLYPSLLSMIIFTILVGIMKLSKVHLKSLLEVVISSSFFSSNLYFLYIDKGDYFNNDTKRNPLLHLWSLGVEEQFYFIWPIILMLISKFKSSNKENKGKIVFLILISSSFILNLLTVYYMKNDKLSFYFPFSRFWQILLGSMIAYYEFSNEIKEKNDSHMKSLLLNSISLFSLLTIIFSSFYITENHKYPGVLALLPSISSAIIIAVNNRSIVNNFILSNKIFVFIGKISYPLYLWHYPILILYQKVGNQIEEHSSLSLLVVSIVFSILTYFFIEKTIQARNFKRIVIVLIMIMTIITLFSFTLLNNLDVLFPIKTTDKSIKYKKIHEEMTKFEKITSNFSNIVRTNTSNSSSQVSQAEVIYKIPDISNQTYLDYLNKVLTPYSPFMKKINYTSIKNLSLLPKKDETSIEKLNFSPGLEEFFEDMYSISSDSPYYTTYGGFVFNDGQKEKVIFIGDSHAEFAIYRAHYLKRVYGLNNFPTVIIKQMYGNAVSLPCEHTDSKINDYEENLKMIKKIKPNSVFIAGIYDVYINQDHKNEEDVLHDPVKCCRVNYDCKFQSTKDVDYIFSKFSKDIKELTDMGIKVFVATLKPIGDDFNPKFMHKDNEILYEKLSPVRLSEYLLDNLFLYNRLNKAILDGGASIIDYTENLCYNDYCNVLNPDGIPVNKEESHPNNYVIREYLDVLDKVYGK